MAEVAAGAVTSLLGVIRSEARLLRLVRSDVQFIKEEMESMNSFLAHLARSAQPGSEHDEQVRTWMNQVRLLAQDCHNCIELYLYRRNPDIHRARGSLRRYLWWVYWYLHKLVAQHHAAVRLRELKDRARDVGERRLRYGVEVPSKSEAAAGQSTPASWLMSAAASSSAATAGYGYAAQDNEEDGDDDQDQLPKTDRSAKRVLFSRTLEDYVKMKLSEWSQGFPSNAGETMSIAIVAPDRDLDALGLAQTMVFGPHYDYEYNRGAGYHCAVLVDISALHPDFSPLRPKEVLYYILRQLKYDLLEFQSQKQGTDQGEGEAEGLDSWQVYIRKLYVYHEKKRAFNKIKENIKRMKIGKKLDEIKNYIKTLPLNGQQKEGMYQQDPDVHVLLKQLLWTSAAASQQDKLKNKDIPRLPASENTITKIANKLKKHMEADEQGGEGGAGRRVDFEEEKEITEERGEGEILDEHVERANDDDEDDNSYADDEEGEKQQIAQIYLHEDQYVHILRQVFLRTSSSTISASKQATNTILGENQNKQMIDETNQKILREPQEGKHDRIKETGQNTEDIFPEIIVDQKMDKIKKEFKEQLKIKGLIDDIKDQMEDKCPLFILKIDETVDLLRWEDTRNALSLLELSADVLIVTTAKDIQQAKEYCYPLSEPIDYSLAGLYQRKNEENYDPQIFNNILKLCATNEFCMKIFAHALYINPNRSNEELNKLHRNIQASSKSFDIIAKKMFKFSYTDMSKEYKSCFLYLVIFPPGYKIRRSTLIGRWVAEGLILKEDWLTSVHWANRCFDELINRCLVDPAEIDAAEKVKSCVVRDLVHGFITKMARKQHIVETRLSCHLARHFSIFNDLQLRSSDRIEGFFQSLSKSSRVSLLKVLDLEGCQCFGGKNQRYLEDICSKMLFLKYLSLRGTDVTQLPSKINNLRELEVLDIRQTNVPMNATANVLLLKLKRLLAGHTGRSPSSYVQIPHKIEKMVNMEVLSNVKARNSRDLKDIGKLWQLRKLGVVVDDNSSYLKNLLQAISDLHECLCSLSITLHTARSEGTPSTEDLPAESLKHPPKLLESLSISGTTQKGHLLPLFIKDVNNNFLVRLTLCSTSLNQNNLGILAKLPKLQFISLRQIAFTDIKSLIFKEDEFKYLKYLLVEGSSFTKISFKYKAACMLEKMALSFTNIESVSGVDRLKQLEEVKLSMSSSNKNSNTLLSSFKNGKKMAKLTLVITLPEKGDQQTQNKIIFNEGEFWTLKLLTVDSSAITEVEFTSGSAPKLEKIICSSSTSLFGIDNLSRLKELEFNGDSVPEVVKEAIKNKKIRPNLIHNKPETKKQAKGDKQEDDNHAARFKPFCCKKQV